MMDVSALLPSTGRVVTAGAVVGTVGWLLSLAPAGTPGSGYWAVWLLAGTMLVLGTVMVWRHRRSGSSGLVSRWSSRSRRNQGVASVWVILRVSSAWAMRRRAMILRPSLAGLSWWRRWRTPIRELATPVARVGWLRVWSPIEDVTLRVGGPRVGKTGELCCRILDAPGAVIATSTRTDLVTVTGPSRARRGPVYVFNPSQVGNLPTTITFSPLSGCEDAVVAAARAEDLLAGLPAPSGGDGEFWLTAARRALAPLLHAAALGGATMRDVQAWLVGPDAAAPDVMRLLLRSPEPAMEQDAAQFFSLPDRSRSSTTATILPALGWLAIAGAAEVARDGDFDVAQLLAERGTVYLLGAEDAKTTPLVTALTGHIAREARRIAALQPQGRLDPPLTLTLDEAALVCPVPLPLWTADMGGRNVTIHIAAQSRAQLRQRWGDTGTAAIMNNAATLLIFGGTRDPDDLAAYSALSGERYERVQTLDSTGAVTSVTTHRVSVLSAALIAQLPAEHAVVIRRGMPPAVGTVQMAWQRRDIRGDQRRTPTVATTTTPHASRLRVVPPPPDTSEAA